MNNNQKHWSLYVLRLEQGKWYVGITTKDPKVRYEEHRNNIRAAAWTRTYQPIELVDSIRLGYISEKSAKRREDGATIIHMRKYGINNVRGGQYTELDDYVIIGRRFFRKDVWVVVKSLIISMTMMFLFMLAAVIASYLT